MNPNTKLKLLKLNRILNWVVVLAAIWLFGVQQSALRLSWENERAVSAELDRIHMSARMAAARAR